MVSIEWCLKQKNGMEIIEPNQNMAESYIKMAEESIDVLNDIKNSNIWIATTSYYIFYYSLYSLLLRLGVKCEIHTCSLEFMNQFLMDFYDLEDSKNIQQSFKNRIDLQYYSNRPVDQEKINDSKKYCKLFFLKTKGILSHITDNEIDNIREKVKFQKS